MSKEETPISDFLKWKSACDSLDKFYCNCKSILSHSISTELKESIKTQSSLVQLELIKLTLMISDAQKKCKHDWKAVYRCDGETHGVLLENVRINIF